MEVRINEQIGRCPGHNYTHEQFREVPKGGTFFFCTIEEAKYLQDMMLGTVAYSRSAFDVHEWLPMIGSNALNWHGSYYLHAGQLSDREIGMFCRSDSGDKAWAGQLIRDASDVELVKDQVPRDEMLFVAPKRDFSAEWLADDLYEPDDMYVIDIARSGKHNLVVEYNAYSTSGFYGVDAKGLVEATKRRFEK